MRKPIDAGVEETLAVADAIHKNEAAWHQVRLESGRIWDLTQ
jgi:hypothetical protein